MFSTSEVGREALRMLFEFYVERRKTTAGVLCQQLGIKVTARNIQLFRAYLYARAECEITVSRAAWQVLRQFNSYHELAHWCLMRYDSAIFLPRENLGYIKITAEVEYWCDAFATAMLFSCEGVELLHKNNYVEFLCCGIPDKWTNDTYTEGLIIFQGERIMRLSCAEFTPPHSELLFLGKAFVQEGLRLKEAAA